MARRKPKPSAIVHKAQTELAKVNEGIARALTEDLFVSTLHADKISVRCVAEGKDVYLYGTDEEALRTIHDTLIQGATLHARRIVPPSREELSRLLDAPKGKK